MSIFWGLTIFRLQFPTASTLLSHCYNSKKPRKAHFIIRPFPIHHFRPTISYQPLSANYFPSTIFHELFSINYFPSTIFHEPFSINHFPLTTPQTPPLGPIVKQGNIYAFRGKNICIWCVVFRFLRIFGHSKG